MKDLILYTYNPEEFKSYKEIRVKENALILSLPLLTEDILNIAETNSEVELDLDLTSITQAIQQERVPLYLAEQVLVAQTSNSSINYLIEKDYASIALDYFKYFFKNSQGIDNSYRLPTTPDSIFSKERSKKKLTLIKQDRVTKLKEKIDKELVGHNIFKQDLFEEINSFRFFNKKIKDQPILSIFLLGPSGVGKTEVARIIHSFLDSKSPLAKMNFGNYQSEESLSSIIGSPPGFRDSGSQSDFVMKIDKSNTGIILIDEFEKANSSIHNFFLQLLEEGQFDDALGNVHDLNGYVIIFTSNLDNKRFYEKISPELISRFSLIHHFDYLNVNEKKEFFANTIQRYNKKGKLQLSDFKIDEISNNIDFDNLTNLRQLRDEIRRSLFEHWNSK